MNKKVIVGDYTDPDTGIRCIEDDRGNYHFFSPTSSNGGGVGDIYINIPEIKIPPIEVPESKVTVEVKLPDEDPEKKRLLRIIEALRSENNWLWSVIMTAIIDRKKKGAPTAMDELEKKIKERQRA